MLQGPYEDHYGLGSCERGLLGYRARNDNPSTDPCSINHFITLESIIP